jgi:hypothetical protein
MTAELPEQPWVERRDRASRASRDAVAHRLDLHPRVLGSLPPEVVEAMRDQLGRGPRRSLDVARMRAVELTERAESLAQGAADLGDAEVDRLVAEVRRTAARLLERLQALSPARRS